MIDPKHPWRVRVKDRKGSKEDCYDYVKVSPPKRIHLNKGGITCSHTWRGKDEGGD